MSQLCLPLPNKAIKPFFVLFSHPVRSDSLWSHGLQHSRPPCPSPSPGVCPSSFPLHRLCYLAISFSDALFSFSPQSFLTSGTFSVSQLFTLGSQNTRASASASVLPMNIQNWFLLGWTGWTSLKTMVSCWKLLITGDYVIKGHSSILAWEIPWTEEPGMLQSLGL